MADNRRRQQKYHLPGRMWIQPFCKVGKRKGESQSSRSGQVTNCRDKNLTLLLAIPPSDAVGYHEVQVELVDGERFQQFKDKLSEVVGEVFDCTFIKDNAQIHRNFIPYQLEGLRQTPPERANGGSPQPKICSSGKCRFDNVSEAHTARDREGSDRNRNCDSNHVL